MSTTMPTSIAMPTFGPLDAATGVMYELLITVTEALAPLSGGVAAVAAIVLVTAAVRLLLVPLARRQVAAQKAQTRLLPQLQQLRQRYAGTPSDPDARARMHAEMMDLYRGAGSSPFAFLLPTLLQLPVLVVLYTVFTAPAVGARPNQLLTADLLGVTLGAHGLAAGWPLLAVLVGIVLVATVSAGRMRRAGQPTWLAVLPYLTVVPAAFVPLAAGVYLLTTTTWSVVETAVLRREPAAAPAPGKA